MEYFNLDVIKKINQKKAQPIEKFIWAKPSNKPYTKIKHRKMSIGELQITPQIQALLTVLKENNFIHFNQAVELMKNIGFKFVTDNKKIQKDMLKNVIIKIKSYATNCVDYTELSDGLYFSGNPVLIEKEMNKWY